MSTHIVRKGLAALLIASALGPAVPLQRTSAEPSAVTVAVTRNFYPEEVWEPGKQRRWMANDGEIELVNSGPEAEVDLRFVAESFHGSRQLQVLAGEAAVVSLLIPPAASRYIVVKRLRVPSGNTTIRFAASPGPARVNGVIASSDAREVSIAFGPFSTVASASPEAQIGQTGAFPEATWRLPVYTADEEVANNMRRQGRFAEALAGYRNLIAAASAGPLSYAWAGLCALALGAPAEARALFRGGREAPGPPLARGYAAKVTPQLDEFVAKSELIRRLDPISGLRTSGQIYLAVPEYEAALRANPNDEVAGFWLGIIYAVAERTADARARFEAIIQSHPETRDAELLRTFMKLAP